MNKALASDIDGTLIFNGHYKENDVDAIREYQKAGYLFGLCTGRPIKGTKNILPEDIQPDFYIATSGAVILDKQGHVLYENIIPFDDVQQVYNEYHQYTIVIQTDNLLYKTAYEEYDEDDIIIHSLDEIRDKKIYGISLIFDNDEQASVICQNINQNFEALEGFQNKNSIDIVKRGCSKGNGVQRIKELLHIDDMAGIGDSYNDIPMLKIVNYSFTFKTSPLDLQQQVSYVVDNIAEAINILMK